MHLYSRARNSNFLSFTYTPMESDLSKLSQDAKNYIECLTRITVIHSKIFVTCIKSQYKHYATLRWARSAQFNERGLNFWIVDALYTLECSNKKKVTLLYVMAKRNKMSFKAITTDHEIYSSTKLMEMSFEEAYNLMLRDKKNVHEVPLRDYQYSLRNVQTVVYKTCKYEFSTDELDT